MEMTTYDSYSIYLMGMTEMLVCVCISVHNYITIPYNVSLETKLLVSIDIIIQHSGRPSLL